MIIPLWPIVALSFRLTVWYKTPTRESPLLQSTPARKLNLGQRLLCRPTRTIFLTRNRAKADGAFSATLSEEARSRMPNQRVLDPLKTGKTPVRPRPAKHPLLLRLPKHRHPPQRRLPIDHTISASLWNGLISASAHTNLCASSLHDSHFQHRAS